MTGELPHEFATLIEACAAGDQAAMARFVAHFQGPVFGLCWRMLRHRQDAEDAAQETLLRALRHLDHWDRSRPFEPWLLAIAANRCRTQLGRRRLPIAAVELTPESVVDVDWHSDAERLREELALVLQQVRPCWARAFQMFHESELSYAEIAELLEIPIGTAKTWVHRARREIVAHLLRREVIFEDHHAVRAG